MTAPAHKHGPHGHGVNLATDPVCGMRLDPHTAKHRAEYEGRTYYFCSADCREKFLANPKRYLSAEPEPVPAGTIYTCPMHPDIRRLGPGACPICGMALEPLIATTDSGPNPALIDMKRRFWIGLALSIPVVALEMGSHLLGLHLLAPDVSNWVQLA
ncbi:MAG TPA: YHS domain-containing protein, partial [Xanthobacteraceae bacterium]|nr:YHS domain-containing protein [Xanthobacteraceae bacterium]